MLSLVLCFLSYYAFSSIMLSLVLCFLSYYAFSHIIFYATLRVQYCHRDKHQNINLTYLYYTTLLGHCEEEYSCFNTVGNNILADRVLSKKIWAACEVNIPSSTKSSVNSSTDLKTINAACLETYCVSTELSIWRTYSSAYHNMAIAIL